MRQIRYLIAGKYPNLHPSMINTGIGGNTVNNLILTVGRMIAFAIDPIGINDLHRWLNQVPGQAVGPEKFAEFYDTILTRVRKETKAKVILVEPF